MAADVTLPWLGVFDVDAPWETASKTEVVEKFKITYAKGFTEISFENLAALLVARPKQFIIAGAATEELTTPMTEQVTNEELKELAAVVRGPPPP